MMHVVHNLIEYSLPHGWYTNPKSTIRNQICLGRKFTKRKVP
jgi:hypothetical protein